MQKDQRYSIFFSVKSVLFFPKKYKKTLHKKGGLKKVRGISIRLEIHGYCLEYKVNIFIFFKKRLSRKYIRIQKIVADCSINAAEF